MILIIGSEGSMGKRYQAILKHLSQPFEGWDPKHGTAPCHPEKYSRFIIASPTDTHLGWVKALDQYGKPILCEKPLSKDLGEVEEILKCKSELTMMMQYTWLFDRYSFGHSSYNYYQHGPDGLIWDCFQIIALARHEVELKEDSPIWKCVINGKPIRRGDMDEAYVGFVSAWLKGIVPAAKQRLLEWHRKVKDYEEKWNSQASA